MGRRRVRNLYLSRDVAPAVPDAPTGTTELAEPSTGVEPTWRTAIELWLRWNAAQEKVTAFMFSNGHQREKVEHLLDEIEQMR